MARVCATRAAHLPRVYARVGELPLEQLPLAARHHELSEHAPAHRQPRDLRRTRVGRGLAVISAGTLMAVAPLLVAFLLLQKQFMQSFVQARIK
jgi:hypothetical protein